MNDEILLKNFRENWFRHAQTQTDFHLNESETLLIEKHFQLLMKWNKVHNLTAVADVESLVCEHYLDCIKALSLWKPHESTKTSVYDLGSGNGLPGLIGAILYPKIHFDLVESSRKKCSFLRSATAQLGLKNVTVRQQRAEDLTAVTTAITRAAFSEPKIDQLSEFFAPSGHLVLMTVPSFPSSSWDHQKSPWVIEERYPYLLQSGAPRSVVVLRKKTSST